MGHDKTIDRFDGRYSFLSNFQFCYVRLGGKLYLSVEHAFQAAKTHSKKERREIRQAHTPGHAKRLGRRVELRDDWEDVKEEIMLDLLRQKFCDREFATKLLDTGDAQLVEGNHWGDTYWGRCDGKGLNRLGVLLMKVRDEIVAARSHLP